MSDLESELLMVLVSDLVFVMGFVLLMWSVFELVSELLMLSVFG